MEDATRDVVKTASMTIAVANTSEAADKAAVMVEDVDGRVDSRSEDAGSDRGFARMSAVVLRVPVAKLDGVVRELKTLGTVQTAVTTSEDVTAQRLDLDARIKALQTSVDRLLAIMRDAGDPEALISAEDALSQRQADLDSLRAQRDALGDRIEYSTVDVTFVAESIGAGRRPRSTSSAARRRRNRWFRGSPASRFGLPLHSAGRELAVAVGLGYGVIRLVGARHPRRALSAQSSQPAAS